MKKLTKKIYLSIVSIFIALIALGTSTYAWFSMGTGATVSGMQVNATADSVFLKIAKSSNGTYDIKAAYTASDAQQLLPIAHEGSDGSYSWYYGYAETKSSATIKSGSMRTVSSQGELDSKYLYHKTVYLKTGTENDAKNLYVKEVKITDNNNSVSEALRVLIVCGTNYHEYKYSDIVSSEGVKTEGSDGHFSATDVPKYFLASEVTDTPVQVDIYIYFDGNDASLMSSNATALSNSLVVDVKFGVEGTK